MTRMLSLRQTRLHSVIGALCLLASTARQVGAQPPCVFIEPQQNTALARGQEFTVRVQCEVVDTTGARIMGEEIETVLVATPSLNSFDYTARISPFAKLGRHHITFARVGLVDSVPRLDFLTSPLALDVMSNDDIVRVELRKTIRLEYVGQQLTLQLSGRTASGKAVGLSGASSWSFRSQNPAIVNVDPSGAVLAVGFGTAMIEATYRRSGKSFATTVEARVAGAIRGDLNDDGDIDGDDLVVLDSWVNRMATTAGDARDLNADGMIDSVDRDLLATLCTRPGCTMR